MSFSSQVSMIFASKDIYSSPNGRHHRKFMSQQTLLIGHHCLIKMMASAKSSICSKITSVRMREKKSESKKSLPRRSSAFIGVQELKNLGRGTYTVPTTW